MKLYYQHTWLSPEVGRLNVCGCEGTSAMLAAKAAARASSSVIFCCWKAAVERLVAATGAREGCSTIKKIFILTYYFVGTTRVWFQSC